MTLLRKPLRLGLGFALVAALSACGASGVSTAPFETVAGDSVALVAETPSPDGPVHRAATSLEVDQSAHPDGATHTGYRLVNYEIKVPEELTVSEANLYYPVADIVWRGDAYGNRKAQVGQIFQHSLHRARADQPQDGHPVVAEIVVNRFHSVTEKTRYTVGGVHSISFFVTLRDARSGEVLVDGRKVKADLNALGGFRAKRAERQGLGMKVRIQHHLTRVIGAELRHPGGWQDQGETLSRAIDQI